MLCRDSKMNVTLEYGQIKGEKMTEDQINEMADEVFTPKHVALFQDNALKLARTIVLTNDWADTERTTNIKKMAQDLIPARWVKEEF